MRVSLDVLGITIGDERNQLGPLRPAARVVIDGRERNWEPQQFAVDGGTLRAADGPGGLSLELQLVPLADQQIELRARLHNHGPDPIAIERLIVFSSDRMRLGDDPRRWRTYRNGYQSWSGTYTLGTADGDRDLPFAFARAGVTDRRHPAPRRAGHIRSDALTAICEPISHDALAIGFIDLTAAFSFIEIDAPAGELRRLSAWVDLDGTLLPPQSSTAEFSVRLRFERGRDCGWRSLRQLAIAIGEGQRARGRGRPHPGGWCSWYYYFNRVTERDMLDNLALLEADGRNGPAFGCEYVMVDDGHQSRIGDWLRSCPQKFPSGMAELARRICAAGFDAGIWWAPFLVDPASEVARNHPEWLVRNQRGRPIVGCSLNPWWGVTVRMAVLDTTRPEVLAHLEEVARTIRADWGYAIQKLDFLYAAALPGMRFDPTQTRAQSLRGGLEAIRRGAGEDAFLLGCGCPLGPAIGVVDAMRIGADVTPYWTNWLARTVLRDVHGLATRHALMNTLTRAVLDGAWWLNDPDCLMVRDRDTTLNEEEVRLLVTVFGMTDGMIVLSDRLDQLTPARRDLVARARQFTGGQVEIPDLFENSPPQLIVSRRPERVDIAVLNLGDLPAPRRLGLDRLGIARPDGELREQWTGATVRIRAGVVDLGELPPHSARVLTII